MQPQLLRTELYTEKITVHKTLISQRKSLKFHGVQFSQTESNEQRFLDTYSKMN